MIADGLLATNADNFNECHLKENSFSTIFRIHTANSLDSPIFFLNTNKHFSHSGVIYHGEIDEIMGLALYQH